MKILFFGCKGWIGKQFGDYLNNQEFHSKQKNILLN
jgi:hypothetical protein